MTTKTKTNARARNAKNPQPKRAIDDTFVAPKAKPRDKTKDVTLAEALAEAGQTIEDLVVPNQEAAPTRPVGTSNLANTIRAHRSQYKVVQAPTGKKTQNNGDAVAQALLNVTLEQMKAFVGAKQPGLNYDQLNPGHQRMCYGNKIRAWYKQGDQTTLLWMEQAHVNAEHAKQDAEPAAEEAPKTMQLDDLSAVLQQPKKRQRKTKGE